MRTFRSDNNAGLCPEALEAIVEANDGSHSLGYGDDEITSRAEQSFKRLFGDDTAVYFVATGTGANTLAIAALTEPWEQVVCHRHSHWNDDESTAPERITHCRCTAVESDPSFILPSDVAFVAENARGDVHQPQPGVLTVSNSTEFGTVYQPDALRELCAVAHGAGFRVHLDGARFANAVASVGCSPAELANAAGIDALSFGGTKNGLAFGEAILFFPQGDGKAYERAVHALPFHRKGTGHLLSKHRFVSAPFARVLDDGSWLSHAAHANAMARRLGDGLAACGLEPAFPVQANGVFVRLPEAVDQALQRAGHGYYPFGDAAEGIFRMMCSFDTSEEDVDSLLGVVSDITG